MLWEIGDRRRQPNRAQQHNSFVWVQASVRPVAPIKGWKLCTWVSGLSIKWNIRSTTYETAINTNKSGCGHSGISANGRLPDCRRQRRRTSCLEEGVPACAVGLQSHNGHDSPAATGYQRTCPVQGLGCEIQRETLLRVSHREEG